MDAHPIPILVRRDRVILRRLLLLVIFISASSSWRQPKVLAESATAVSKTMYLPLIERQVWRPFSDTSPWNTPIPSNPEIDPNSNAMIAQLLSAGDDQFWANVHGGTVPVWYVGSSTPRYTVPCIESTCRPGFNPVSIPDGALPDPYGDAHMLILDMAQQKSWDMWHAHKNLDGSWTVGVGISFDLTGDGVRPLGKGAARAAGFPLAAGLIYYDEVKAGHIRHALVMSYDLPRNCLVYPASTNGGRSSDPNAIPFGGHLQLDPSLNLDTLGLSLGAKVVARAMQEYGLYVGDNGGGGPTVYAQSFYGRPGDPWQGILTEKDLLKILASQLRVLKLGPVDCTH